MFQKNFYFLFAIEDLNTIFTVEEAVCRVQVGDFKDKTFSLPDLYGDAWTLERGMAGVFGKNFYNYISEHNELGIRAQGYDKKHDVKFTSMKRRTNP